MEKRHSVKCIAVGDKGAVVSPDSCSCDGYHTFEELYDHRITLFVALCRTLKNDANHNGIWASVQHADCSTFGDWFVMGIGKEKGKQITYHLPARYWHEVCEFAEILEKAPEWDGHTSDDVLKRLASL